MKKLTATEAHRSAGIIGLFMWQDEIAETKGDPKYVEIEYTSLVGTLPEKVNGSKVYIMLVRATATSHFGYQYPVDRTLKIALQENGEPIVDDATEEEIASAKEHNKAVACRDYATLMQLVHAGAYTTHDDGTDWYEDTNISEEVLRLDRWALAQELQFTEQPDHTYTLEAASQEALDAYRQALALESEEDDDE